MEYLFNGLALLILLFLSAFFSGSETAIFHLSKVTIEKLVHTDIETKSSRSLSILGERERLLGTILFGNTLVNVSASIIAARLFCQLFQNLATSGLAIVTGIMTYLILVFGEFTPKLYSLRNAERVSLKSIPYLRLIRYLFLPITIPIDALISLIHRILRISPSSRTLLTRDEFRALVEGEEGYLTPPEKEIILKLLDFKNKQVGDIMTPRVKLECLEASTKLGPAEISKLSYSRIPVYENSPNHIIGILYLKDLLTRDNPVVNEVNPSEIREILREPYFVLASMSARELLSQFQKRRVHIAVVVGERKNAVGIATLDDILNTIIRKTCGERSDSK